MTARPFRRAGLLAIALVAGLLAGPAVAHDARPFSVSLEEQAGNAYLVRLRVPPTVAYDNRPGLSWPKDCRRANHRASQSLPGGSETLMLACESSLEGRTLTVAYPLYNPSLATLFRLQRSDGSVLTRLLAPDEREWQVPRDPSRGEVAWGYLKLGIEHIWGGIDHLLFVTGLLILAGSMKRVLLAVTGFTIAHSITLTLSTLGLFRLPIAPVEAIIALSILFLAREIARPTPDGLARRFPIAVSSTFGLLHGFGFAAALREVGLPRGELATGLLCFNLGVEIGQIVFIAGLLALFVGARAIVRRSDYAWPQWKLTGAKIAGYALGLPAAFWFIERLGPAL